MSRPTDKTALPPVHNGSPSNHPCRVPQAYSNQSGCKALIDAKKIKAEHKNFNITPYNSRQNRYEAHILSVCPYFTNNILIFG